MNQPRAEVAWFAEQMELKLRENDHKPHWRGSDIEYLHKRLQEEVDELMYELHSPLNEERVVKEAADVANFAMMIADVARQVAVPTRRAK
jgi:NTP pyrophosphatase (non-canonical NTP hydrolase)